METRLAEPQKEPPCPVHRLLAIQLQKHVGILDTQDLGQLPEGWGSFLEGVNQAYRQFDRDLLLAHRSLALDPEELRAVCEHQQEVLDSLRLTARSLLPSGNIAEDLDDSGGRPLSILLGRLICEREEARQRLEESEAQYRSLVESVEEVIFRLDLEGRLQFLNQAWTEITGWSLRETLGRSFLDFAPPEDHVNLKRRFRDVVQDLPSRGPRELRCRTADGAIKCLRVHARVMKDGHLGISGTMVDLTKQKRQEAALLQAQKLESLGVLAGSIAHDFNNLLVAIQGNADLAAHYLEDPVRTRRHLDQVQVGIGRAADLCRQLLAYSGRGRFTTEVLDLNALVAEMTHLLKVSIGRDVTLEFDQGPELAFIEADPSQLRQAVMNLVINASEAIGERSGRIRISLSMGSEDRIPDAGFHTFLAPDLPPGPSVCLRVEDSGCGMDEETLKRIFDPFFTTKFTGRGLGLAAILGIVQNHQGALRVQSRPGTGTTFCLTFPATAPAATPPPVEEDFPLRTEGLVLLADDEESVRELLGEALEVMGFTVLQARNGQEAVDLFLEHQGTILAVLLDLTMPVLGGDEVFRRIQKAQPGTPTLLMSGYSEQETRILLGSTGLSGFLQKPFKLIDLSRALKKALAAAETPV